MKDENENFFFLTFQLVSLELVIFKLISRVDILSTSFEGAHSWMPQDLTYAKSTLKAISKQMLKIFILHISNNLTISQRPMSLMKITIGP